MSAQDAKRQRTLPAALDPVTADAYNHKVCKEKGLVATSFENYSETSKVYDSFEGKKSRVPMGGYIHLGLFAAGHPGRSDMKPISQQSVLDIGCGTANYLEPIWGSIGKYTGLDLSVGMLEQAKAKVAKLTPSATTTSFVHASMDKLPFEANSFDNAMFNQSIHHLPSEDDYACLQRAMNETARVLKPGGVCVINTTAQEQIDKGYWWSAIIPAGLARTQKRFPLARVCEDTLKKMGENAGLEYGSATVPVDLTLQAPETLYNVEGPFKKQFRDGDSTWAMATEDELAEGLAAHRKRIQDKTIDAWMAEREELRKTFGQSVFICFYKPMN